MGRAGAVQQLSASMARDMNDGYRNDPAYQPGVACSPRPSAVLPIDAVSEMRRTLELLSQSTGGNGGAVVNIVTRSGTNQFHGTAFEYFPQQRALGRNVIFFQHIRPTKGPHFHNKSVLAAPSAGPIMKDKTFFFLDYEGQQERVGRCELLACRPRFQPQIAADGGATNAVTAGYVEVLA